MIIQKLYEIRKSLEYCDKNAKNENLQNKRYNNGTRIKKYFY